MQQIKPVESHPYDYIYKWRLQQEHDMKSRNGGKGMSDEQAAKILTVGQAVDFVLATVGPGARAAG